MNAPIALASPPLRIRPDFSFSRAELGFRCAWWLRPDAEWTEDEGNEFSAGGVTLHGLMAALIVCGIIELPEDATLRALYGRAFAWLSTHRRAGMRAEVAFAYNLETGTARELADPPGEGPRWYADAALRAKYGVLDCEIPTRIDLVEFGFDEHGAFLQIYDYKFHFGPHHSDARAQLEACALVASRTYEIDRVRATAVHVWEDRVEEEPLGELGELALSSIAADVAELAHVPANDPQPNAGPHCKERFCPARASCPLTAEVVGELVPAERLAKGAPFSFRKPIATNDEGAWALIAIDLLEAAVAAKKKEAKAFADANGGILQADGKVYSSASHPKCTPVVDVPGAVEALQALDPGIDFALEVSTSWAAIARVGGPELETRAREVLEAVPGAVKASTVTVYMARKVKR